MRQPMLLELDKLVSEGRNPRSLEVDTLSASEILDLMNSEDALVAKAVKAEIPHIACAVDETVNAFLNGGRLIYIGAGTSGRLGVLDASECPPTFGVDDQMVIGLIAGGDHALRFAVEGAEDDEQQAIQDLDAIKVSENDVIVGIAASGRTPYVLSGLKYARTKKAVTVALSCNPRAPISELADIAIAPIVGPEILTGSTRLKSGTAQKMVLNMISTASMIRIGKAYENLMVDLRVSNDKLTARAVRVVMQATGCAEFEATTALTASDKDVKLAIFTLLTGLDIVAARQKLSVAKGVIRQAMNLV